MPATLTRLVLTLALPLGLLLGLLPGTAGGAEFQALGCFPDPTGDAGGVDAADLIQVCVDHGSAVVEVQVFSAGGIRPTSDPAWSNDDTGLAIGLSIDGDSTPDANAAVGVAGNGTLTITGTDPAGGDLTQCEDFAFEALANGTVALTMARDCLADPDTGQAPSTLRASAALAVEVTDGQAVATDRTPDDSDLTFPLPPGDAPPFCDNHAESVIDDVVLARIRCGGEIGGTEPISQAVAVSQFVFDDNDTLPIDPYLGEWAVIVRDDNYADALAGSSLGMGLGPLLFTYSPVSGPALGQDHTRLAPVTEQELLRTVPRGRPVYVLGGTAAIDDGVLAHVTELGYRAVRLAGPSREGTAAAVAREVRRLTVRRAATDPSFTDVNSVMIANRDNWPDAVLAGQVGAFWGMPILLNPATGEGHPETIAALMDIRPHAIHYVGGNGVITSETLVAIRETAVGAGFAMGAPGEAVASDDPDEPWRPFCARRDAEGTITEALWTCRQGGQTRIETGAAVMQLGREMAQRFGETIFGDSRTDVYVSGVSLAGGVDSDNYAYVLAASMLSGRFGGAVFMPTDDGATLHPSVVSAVCFLPRGVDTTGDGEIDTPFIELVSNIGLMADEDKLTDGYGEAIRSLIVDGCP